MASTYYVMQVAKNMHVNMIISESAVKIINKCNAYIAVYWLKSQSTSQGDLCMCSWAVISQYSWLLKLLSSIIKQLWCYIIFAMYWFKSWTMYEICNILCLKQIDLHV